jgi:hypothetical protein
MTKSSTNNERVEKFYLPRIAAPRQKLASTIGARLTALEMAPELLERFLIEFCATGVHMTEPVEGWIRRAGGRCIQVGLPALGRSLEKHAEHEANHHLMMIADTRHLVACWNARRSPKLDADALLQKGSTPATRAYIKLHEDVIASSTPFGQLAIEYEIEGLSTTLGPPLMDQCKRLLGPAIIQGLSFLAEHIEVDQGHTLFNERQLEKLLTEHASFVDPLVRAGAAALEAYGNFLTECLEVAEGEVSSTGPTRRPRPDAQTVQA